VFTQSSSCRFEAPIQRSLQVIFLDSPWVFSSEEDSFTTFNDTLIFYYENQMLLDIYTLNEVYQLRLEIKKRVYFLSVLLKRDIGTVGPNTPYAYLLS